MQCRKRCQKSVATPKQGGKNFKERTSNIKGKYTQLTKNKIKTEKGPLKHPNQ